METFIYVFFSIFFIIKIRIIRYFNDDDNYRKWKWKRFKKFIDLWSMYEEVLHTNQPLYLLYYLLIIEFIYQPPGKKIKYTKFQVNNNYESVTFGLLDMLAIKDEVIVLYNQQMNIRPTAVHLIVSHVILLRTFFFISLPMCVDQFESHFNTLNKRKRMNWTESKTQKPKSTKGKGNERIS